jgi:hypothetical protein
MVASSSTDMTIVAMDCLLCVPTPEDTEENLQKLMEKKGRKKKKKKRNSLRKSPGWWTSKAMIATDDPGMGGSISGDVI